MKVRPILFLRFAEKAIAEQAAKIADDADRHGYEQAQRDIKQ